MPTKINYVGQQQPYVPKGNGDASGEYADKDGYNINFGLKKDKKDEPKTKENKPKTINTSSNNGTLAEQKRMEELGLKNKDKYGDKDIDTQNYTNQFVADAKLVEGYFGFVRTYPAEVKISKGSFNKEDLKQFNTYLKDLFNKYPNMSKFNQIKVDNRASSSVGGYIKTRFDANGNIGNYDLYINASWLNKPTEEEHYKKTLDFYKDRIDYIKNNKGLYTDADGMIKSFEKSISDIEKRLNTKDEDKIVGNVHDRLKTRELRLKGLMAHELMHRIYAENVKSDLQIKINEIYRQAIINGDARKISIYASTNEKEFISEANAMIECGLKVPEYISNIVKEIKGD